MMLVNSSESEKLNEDELASSLEEFGLSKYEARAYTTLVGRGSLSASEVAYYSNLPRTKIYLTLKKLEKKKLSNITQQKPLICNAIAPRDAFGEMVLLYERRLKNMKRIIEELQKKNDNGTNTIGTEEKKYHIFEARKVSEQLYDMIQKTRYSIYAIVDQWGLKILSQYNYLLNSLSKEIEIKILLCHKCLNNELTQSFSKDIQIRIGNVFSNMIIIDSNKLFNIDESNGRAALFSSLDVFGNSYLRAFNREWTNGLDLNTFDKTNS